MMEAAECRRAVWLWGIDGAVRRWRGREGWAVCADRWIWAFVEGRVAAADRGGARFCDVGEVAAVMRTHTGSFAGGADAGTDGGYDHDAPHGGARECGSWPR